MRYDSMRLGILCFVAFVALWGAATWGGLVKPLFQACNSCPLP